MASTVTVGDCAHQRAPSMPPVAAAPRADAIDHDALARDLDARANRDQTIVGPRRVTFSAVGVRESCSHYTVSVLQAARGYGQPIGDDGLVFSQFP
jgi:hypothetical protein